MRLSVDRSDPRFRPGLTPDSATGRVAEAYDVTLDGATVEFVITADEEEGMVLVLSRDEEGGFRHRDGALLREVHRGEVRIVRTR